MYQNFLNTVLLLITTILITFFDFLYYNAFLLMLVTFAQTYTIFVSLWKPAPQLIFNDAAADWLEASLCRPVARKHLVRPILTSRCGALLTSHVAWTALPSLCYPIECPSECALRPIVVDAVAARNMVAKINLPATCSAACNVYLCMCVCVVLHCLTGGEFAKQLHALEQLVGHVRRL